MRLGETAKFSEADENLKRWWGEIGELAELLDVEPGKHENPAFTVQASDKDPKWDVSAVVKAAIAKLR